MSDSPAQGPAKPGARALTIAPAAATLSLMRESATKRLASHVVRKLRSAGHEALLAGGCVRDMLLGHRPVDYDVATSATPKEVKKLFRRVLMVGAKFGVAMVIENRRRIEVATFRTDLSYSDGRRPDGVKFVTAREDAQRRDFTVNGMFYDPIDKQVVDYVGGQRDLRAGVIRAIGKADERFAEDYLRMLRAIRFAARLSFEIDPATAKAIRRHASKISRISGERIREELEKMFAHPQAARAAREMHSLDLLAAILPDLVARDGLVEAALARIDVVGKRHDALLALAALLCDLPAETIRKITRHWGASNRTRDSLVWIAERADQWRTAPESSLAELKRILANRASDALRAIWRVRERMETGSVGRTRAVGQRAVRIQAGQVSPKPFVNGADLKKLGLDEGERMGQVLHQLYEEQLNEQLTSRRDALDRARDIIRTGKSVK